MAVVFSHDKALSSSPLKVSAPLGAAMAFMGMGGSLPLFHGSQGCTAFALVMLVRHFREAIPLQTTAMNEVTTILGGMDQVEEGLLNITRRAKPAIIGLISTALTETRGEDMMGDLKVIMARNKDLSGVAVVPVSAPDFEGSLETGWSKAVTAMIRTLAAPPHACRPVQIRRINLLPGAHMTPGDVDEMKEIIADFGLEATVLPDLSASLDGHVSGTYVPTTLGGTTPAEVRDMGRAALTIAVGEHMRAAAAALQEIAGVPFTVLDRVTGLEAVDRLMVALSSAAHAPVPAKYRRQRSQVVDAMLDGHFFFGGRTIAIAGEPALLETLGRLVTELGAQLIATVSPISSPRLADLPTGTVVVGDFEDLEDQILQAGKCDLIIANSNARQISERHGIPLFRAGFPVFDRLGAAHLTTAGYRGTRNMIFTIGNILMGAPHHSSPLDFAEHVHGHAKVAAG